jgi:hypothetical protein
MVSMDSGASLLICVDVNQGMVPVGVVRGVLVISTCWSNAVRQREAIAGTPPGLLHRETRSCVSDAHAFWKVCRAEKLHVGLSPLHVEAGPFIFSGDSMSFDDLRQSGDFG